MANEKAFSLNAETDLILLLAALLEDTSFIEQNPTSSPHLIISLWIFEEKAV